ncbi:MAG: hypothetical protein GYA24_00815 [Candidatus Lokiarchaeota archaeon]|nr:hypothetical protein [Candidatus Lokiarchaeota archaeon]
MDLCKTLDTKPSPKATKILLLASIAIMLVAYSFMGYFFAASGDMVPIFTSQLSFSDSFLKWQYSLMTPAGLESYRLAQSFDYLYMLSYGLLGFSLALIIGRKFDAGTSWHATGCFLAVAVPVAAGFDAMENLFILLSLADPAWFPAWWAIAHSTFAVLKWIVLFLAVGWAAIATLYYLLVVRRKA